MSHLIVLVMVASLPSIAQAAEQDVRVRTRYLMGTECSITLPGDAAWSLFDLAFDEIDRIESLLSTWRDDTELARLNSSDATEVRVSAEVSQLLSTVSHWARETDGAFNPLVGPLIDIWSSRSHGRHPSEAEITGALDRMRLDDLVVDTSRQIVRRSPGIVIEEGAFGKGYALDLALDLLEAASVSAAYLDFGGQIAIASDSPIEVAIANPERRDEPAVFFRMRSGSLATSSGSERTFELDGTTYSHIIDPRSGFPLPPRGSVSVLHHSALVADILATALYVMGPEQGLAWSDEHDVAALFLDPDPNRAGRYRIRPSIVWRSEYPLTTSFRGNQFVMEDDQNHETVFMDSVSALDSGDAGISTNPNH